MNSQTPPQTLDAIIHDMRETAAASPGHTQMALAQEVVQIRVRVKNTIGGKQ